LLLLAEKHHPLIDIGLLGKKIGTAAGGE